MGSERCDTCKHFQPGTLEGWGVCPLPDLWPARPQEVAGASLACAARGSHWAARNPAHLEQAAPGPAPRPPRTPPQGPSRQARAPSSDELRQYRPRWTVWLMLLGFLMLLVTPGVVLLGPVSLGWFAISVTAIVAGLAGYYFIPRRRWRQKNKPEGSL